MISDSLLSGRVTLLAEEADDATTARTIELTQTSLDRRDLLEQIRTHHREREAAQARDDSDRSVWPWRRSRSSNHIPFGSVGR